MSAPLPPELYYLSNFRQALDWIGARYADLLSAEESRFIARFDALPRPAQALLVRMVMRQGSHFRASKLNYAEIGDLAAPAQQLIDLGWLSDQALLQAAEVAALLRKDELLAHLPLADRRATQKKAELLAQLLALELPAQPFAAWCPALADRLYSLTIGELCDRLRLLFFGNLGQDWSEFVLADLGIFRYEPVAISADSRAFRNRHDVEHYLLLHEQRLRFEAGEPAAALLATLDGFATDNAYLQSRHARLLFLIAQQQERHGELEQALAIYRGSKHAEARWRQIRILEKLARHAEAHALAEAVQTAPHSDEEAQLAERALARLCRKLGLPAPPRRPPQGERRIELELKQPAHGSVELAVAAHLHSAQAPVHYVENTLLCSLFGLLCWEAIFAPLPGAFFHPFQSGPADLSSAEFHARRAGLFAACLQRLDDGSYRQHIRQRYRDKHGTQSPFVFWGLLGEELLDQALRCIPAAHLRACCERLLGDLKANRSGMPDLIQFYPDERRYRMIEVKGPGDRLQDNQKRWLAFAAAHGMPVEVCYVSWSAP